MPSPSRRPPEAPFPLTDRERQALLRLCAVLRAIAARHAAGASLQAPGLTVAAPTPQPMLPPETAAPAAGAPGSVGPP